MVDNVITPPVVEYVFTDRKADPPVQRTFYQSELTIDGEVAILGLVSRTLAILAEHNFPFEKMATLQKEDGSLDVAAAGTLASEFSIFVPAAASESAAILFGYFPTDQMGRRSAEYDEVVAFLRKTMTITRWLDALNVFSDQNDWKRMSTPFVGAIRKGVTLGLWAERVAGSAT